MATLTLFRFHSVLAVTPDNAKKGPKGKKSAFLHKNHQLDLVIDAVMDRAPGANSCQFAAHFVDAGYTCASQNRDGNLSKLIS